MVGISDGNNNGEFKIQKGQGISQAIASELGLNAQQCKSLGRQGWESIFALVKSEHASQKQAGKKGLYSGGEDLFGSSRSNYVVHENAQIEISEKNWKQIIQIVNNKLNIEISTSGQSSAQSATTPSTQKQTVEKPAYYRNVPHTVKIPSISQFKEELRSKNPNKDMLNKMFAKLNSDNIALFINRYNKDSSNFLKDFQSVMGFEQANIIFSYILNQALAFNISVLKYGIKYNADNKSYFFDTTSNKKAYKYINKLSKEIEARTNECIKYDKYVQSNAK